jgi:2-iminobutanoate/2-iminopropanoate deaminase
MTEAGTYLFVSGQIGIDGESGNLVADRVEGQTEQCLKNLLAIVQAAGGSRKSIVKTTVYLRRIEDFPALNTAYAAFFEAPYPARSCVAGCDLPKGALVEIEAIALIER